MEKRTVDASTQLVELNGEIDVYTAPDLRRNLNEAVEAGPLKLIINLEGVRYIDSSGLSVLLEMHKRIRLKNGYMSVICTHSQILKLFNLTGLIKILKVFPTEADALAAATDGTAGRAPTNDEGAAGH